MDFNERKFTASHEKYKTWKAQYFVQYMLDFKSKTAGSIFRTQIVSPNYIAYWRRCSFFVKGCEAESISVVKRGAKINSGYSVLIFTFSITSQSYQKWTVAVSGIVVCFPLVCFHRSFTLRLPDIGRLVITRRNIKLIGVRSVMKASEAIMVDVCYG